MFLGAGFSACSTVVAALAGLEPWAIPQVQCQKKDNEIKEITKVLDKIENIVLQFSQLVANARKLIYLLTANSYYDHDDRRPNCYFS